MYLYKMEEAVREARKTVSDATRQNTEIAKILVGNLRSVTRDKHYSSHSILVSLKKELTQYNAATRTWKN